MGKKSNKGKGTSTGTSKGTGTKEKLQQKVQERKANQDLFVSVCTPTFNRRPFIKTMFKCFLHQDYPMDLIEWIIIDDGTDPIEDLIKEANIPQIKYFKYDTKMPLGKKRNIMHEKSKGDIIVYMDDDDYYPPERISHAVHMLKTHPQAMCAGSSEIYIWFKHIQQMKQFGPYGPNHSTAGTFAFKRELLKDHEYENDAALAEEKAFLKNYTVPFVQLDPMKVILVFSHTHNTFDKKKLLENPNPNYVRDTHKTVDDFVKEADLKQFYMEEIEGLLENYDPGKPSMKPDVLQQIIKIEETRRKHAESMVQNPIMLQKPGEQPKAMNNKEVVDIMNQLRQKGEELANILQQRDSEISMLKNLIGNKDNEIEKLRNTSAAGTSAAGTSVAGTSVAGTSAASTSAAGTSVFDLNDDVGFKLEKLNLLDKMYYEIIETKKLITSNNSNNNNNNSEPPIIAQGPNGEQKRLTNQDIVQILKQKDMEIQQLQHQQQQKQFTMNGNGIMNGNANNNNSWDSNMSSEEKAFLESIGAYNNNDNANNISLEVN